jgi:hypothetical protein
MSERYNYGNRKLAGIMATIAAFLRSVLLVLGNEEWFLFVADE